MLEVGYKLVMNDCGKRLVSFFSGSPITYGIYMWSVPKDGDGPLAVFSNYDDAHKFTRGIDKSYKKHGLFQIYMCEYEEAVCCDSMWISFAEVVYPLDLYNAPCGTVLASRVRLLGRIN